jgi:hypothetical protein
MRTVFIAALALMANIPLSSHHSFAAFYLEDQTITIAGVVVEFEYRNPHAWVHLQSADVGAPARRYGAEWGNPNRLRQQGVTRETIKPGDYLVITGSPGRNPSDYKIHLKRIERPADGWTWVGRGERR